MKKYRYIETFNNLKIVLPECDLAAFYDNTIEFRRFAIYKNGKPVRVSHEIPLWYKKFIENVAILAFETIQEIRNYLYGM